MSLDWVGIKPGNFVNESTIVPIDADNLNAVVKTVDKIAKGGSGTGLDADTWQGLVPNKIINPSDEDLSILLSFDSVVGGADVKIIDESGSGNDAITFGDIQKASGISGRALLFNGSDTYIKGSYSNSTKYTLSAWYKGLSGTGLFRIISLFRISTDSRINLSINDGVAEFRFKNSSGTTQIVSGGIVVADDKFHHICGTHDGSTARIYIDGVLQASISADLNSGYFNELRLGCSELSSPDNFLTGCLDEIRVYTRALSTDEVCGLFFNKGGQKSVLMSDDTYGKTLALRTISGGLKATSLDLQTGFNLKILNGTTGQEEDHNLSISTLKGNRNLTLGSDLEITPEKIKVGSRELTLPATTELTAATLTGTETLTNKTLTQPKINEDVAVSVTATEINKLASIGTETIADQLALKAPLESPSLTGEPTVPDTDVDQNDNQAINTKSTIAQINSSITHLDVFKEWDEGWTYNQFEPTFYNGVPYKSLTNDNQGNIPLSSPLSWEITGGGGGSGEVQNPGIYMTNPTFDEHISGWYGFKNTDINLDYPETGVGGVCDFEISHETISPLIGTGSLRVYKTDESAKGSGFSTDFTVDKGMLLNDDMNVCRLQVSFFDSGSLFFKVFLFLKDTMERIEGIPIFVNTGSGAVKKYIFNIPENTTCLEYRLSFFWPFSYSGEYDALFDEVRISRAEDIYIPSYDEKMAMEKSFVHAPSADNKFVVQSKLTEDIDNTVGIPKWRGINYLANSFVTFNGSIYKSNTETSTDFINNEWYKIPENNFSGFIYNNGDCESVDKNFGYYFESGKQWPEQGIGGTVTLLTLQAQTGSSVLNGSISNKVIKSEGNALGQGINFTFFIEKGSVGQPSTVSFNYLTNETYVDQAIMMAIRDDTNGVVRYVSNHLLKSSYGVPSRHSFVFTPKSSGLHKILFHVQSLETQAWEVMLDNIEVNINNSIATYDAKLSVSVDEEYLVEDRVNNVAVSANVPIRIPSSFELFGKVTVRRLHATDSGYVTITPPAGCTIEGLSEYRLYEQYASVTIERVSATQFVFVGERPWQKVYDGVQNASVSTDISWAKETWVMGTSGGSALNGTIERIKSGTYTSQTLNNYTDISGSQSIGAHIVVNNKVITAYHAYSSGYVGPATQIRVMVR